MPQMMAFDLCGVQPMSAPTGLIFALRARYGETNTDPSTAEAFYNEVYPNFSGTAYNAGNPATHGAGANTGSATNPFAVGRASNLGEAADGGSDGLGNSGTNFVNDPFSDTAGSAAAATNYNPSMAQGTTPYGMTTREGEGDNFREMSFSIERTAVEAKNSCIEIRVHHGIGARPESSSWLGR